MSTRYSLSPRPLERIKPYFPLSRSIPRADGLRAASGIIYVIKHGLQWKNAPKKHWPYKTLYTFSSAGASWVFSTKYFLRLLNKAPL